MHDDTTGSAAKLDLGALSDDELIALLPRIEKELEVRHAARLRDAFEQMRAIADSVGMTPEELVGRASQATSAGRGRRGGRRRAAPPEHPEEPKTPARAGRRPRVPKDQATA